jgi:hypothetical protein
MLANGDEVECRPCRSLAYDCKKLLTNCFGYHPLLPITTDKPALLANRAQGTAETALSGNDLEVTKHQARTNRL